MVKKKKKAKKPKKRSKPRKKKGKKRKPVTNPARKKKKGKKKLTKADVTRSEQVYGKAKREYHRAGERVKKVHQAPIGSTNHWS